MRVMLVLFPLVALVACSSSDNGPESPVAGAIEGRVSTAVGDTAIAGAIVRTGPPAGEASTTSGGTYSIAGVPAGQYTVGAEKAGFSYGTTTVEVTGGLTTTANLRLTRDIYPDSIPPATVHDLRVHSATDSTITLAWTATGADSTEGIATEDLIYYAEDSVSVVTRDPSMFDFWDATQQPQGTTRTYMVIGLSSERTYYFGHRAGDTFGVSGLSNVVRGRTLAPPPGAVWHVPGDAVTIQAAADMAHVRDTILVAPGVYTGPGNRDIDLRGKRLALIGSGGPSVTIIDCQGAGRGINIRDGEGAGVLVRGFTIRNGDVSDRPAMENDGGGIYGASFTLADCVLENNHAESGGGLFCGGDTIRIERCDFRGNDAGSGGAIYSDTAHPTLEDCLIENNTALPEDEGGGIHVSDGSITLRRCSILGNTAGAFSMSGQPAGTCTMEDCLIARNQTTNGDVVYLGDMRGANLQGCRILGNEGTGVVWAGRRGAPFRMDRCTIAGNTSGVYFGFTYEDTPPELTNSIIAFSSDGGDVTSYSAPHVTIRCCDFYGNSWGDWVEVPGQLGVNDNITADPQFCDLPNGDVRLDASSPCAGGSGQCGRMGALDAGCR